MRKLRDTNYYWFEREGGRHHIYFIVSDDGFVKIGRSFNHPINRLDSLQTGNPHGLKLRLFIMGDSKIEKLMHKLFNKYHYRGEWYKFEGILKQFVTYPFSLSLVIDDLYFIEIKDWVF